MLLFFECNVLFCFTKTAQHKNNSMSCTQHCAQKEKKIMEKRVKTLFIYNDFIYESIFYLINAAIITKVAFYFWRFFF